MQVNNILKFYLFQTNFKLTINIVLLVWHCSAAYMALLPTKIVSYNHIALLYACIPIISVFGPIGIGNEQFFFRDFDQFDQIIRRYNVIIIFHLSRIPR